MDLVGNTGLHVEMVLWGVCCSTMLLFIKPYELASFPDSMDHSCLGSALDNGAISVRRTGNFPQSTGADGGSCAGSPADGKTHKTVDPHKNSRKGDQRSG